MIFVWAILQCHGTVTWAVMCENIKGGIIGIKGVKSNLIARNELNLKC